MAANQTYHTLGDIVRKGWNLAVQCGCGHSAVIDAARMDRWYHCHMWPTTLHMLRDHLYWLRCGGRPDQVRLRATASSPTAPPGRFPCNEAGWKRLVRGLRG